jgi:hypothetical protein
MKLDYCEFWSQAGGVRRGNVYLLFSEPIEKPLREIPITHRSRTRRKRERKSHIRQEIETRLRLLFKAHARLSAIARHAQWTRLVNTVCGEAISERH